MCFRRVGVLLGMFTFGLLVVSACSSGGSNNGGGGGSSVVHQPQVIVDDLKVLKDGEWYSWRLGPGSYRVDVTASNDGVTLEWVGSSCPKSQPSNNFSDACTLSQTGQVIITNPTTFGLGSSSSVTVKITKL